MFARATIIDGNFCTATPGKVKSDGWTEAYHRGRALLNVSADLKRLAGAGMAR